MGGGTGSGSGQIYYNTGTGNVQVVSGGTMGASYSAATKHMDEPCERCRALVWDVEMDEHLAWHKKQDAVERLMTQWVLEKFPGVLDEVLEEDDH